MKTEKIQTATPTPNEARIRQLKQLFPECLTEGKVDTEKLQNILPDCEVKRGVVNGNDRQTEKRKLNQPRNLIPNLQKSAPCGILSYQ